MSKTLRYEGTVSYGSDLVQQLDKSLAESAAVKPSPALAAAVAVSLIALRSEIFDRDWEPEDLCFSDG